jgi:hypothetical protein
MNQVYLRPALIEAGYADWQDVVIAMDDSQVVISPDRTADADQALDRIAIGFEGYRTLKGIPESMAPSDEEKQFLATLKLRQEVNLEGQELVVAQSGPQAAPQTGGDAADGPSQPTAGRNGSRQESRTASAHILGAADLALLRCRELAGIRIRHKCKECGDGAPDALVASVMGSTRVPDPMKLVHGGTDGLRSLLTTRGFGDDMATSLCQTLEVYAARTLFEAKQPDLPSGFMAQVENAREVGDVYN